MSNKRKSSSAKSSDRSFMQSLMRIFGYMKNERINIILIFAFAVLSTVFTIIGPKILGNATTEIYKGVMRRLQNPADGIDFGAILKILITLLVLYSASSVFAYAQSYIMSGVAQRISYNLRKEISEKFNRMPVSYYDKNNRGDLISRVTNDVDTLNQSLNESLMSIVTSIVTLVGVFIMMLSISVVMTLAALILLPLTAVLLRLVIKKSQLYFKMQQKYLGKVNGKVEECFSGQNIVRGYNGESFEQHDFDRMNSKLYESGWKSQFLSSIMMPLMRLVGNVGYVIVSILGGYLAINGKITVGDIQAFAQYMRSFTQPLNQIAQIMNFMQSTVAAADRVFDFLDEKEEDDSSDKTVDEKTFRGEIEFRNVKFGYRKDEIVIKNFSLDVKPGEKVAIVGPTGAGKTTLVKLLMRFYDPVSGEILLDGQNIKDFDRDSYRKNFAMVLQDTWLFSGTIKENLKYGKLDATDEQVYAAARAAHIDRFIMTQKNGYDTVLSEDSKNISQGQKQLMTIARAILSDPKILILDEATSSVDTRTEELIQKAMDNLIKDRTSFIIAHRLSTIRNADNILVLNDGDIVEQGTHDELMEKGGFYKSLYNSQYEDLEDVN